MGVLNSTGRGGGLVLNSGGGRSIYWFGGLKLYVLNSIGSGRMGVTNSAYHTMGGGVVHIVRPLPMYGGGRYFESTLFWF